MYNRRSLCNNADISCLEHNYKGSLYLLSHYKVHSITGIYLAYNSEVAVITCVYQLYSDSDNEPLIAYQ